MRPITEGVRVPVEARVGRYFGGGLRHFDAWLHADY